MVEHLPDSTRPGQMPSASAMALGRNQPPPFGSLAPDVAQLWAAPLDLSVAELNAFSNSLSEAERDRSARFHFDVHRNRYIAAHGWLRRVLSGYLSVGPQEVQFSHGARGKPFLAGSFSASGFEFNLSHSEDLALIGVGQGIPIGVDLEKVRPVEDAGQLVARFFCSRESAKFQELPDQQKPRAFFNLWTRKEAWLKATGEGIAHLLNAVEVSFLPEEAAELISLPEAYGNKAAWSIYDIPLPSEYSAALAAGCARVRPEVHWTHELRGIGL